MYEQPLRPPKDLRLAGGAEGAGCRKGHRTKGENIMEASKVYYTTFRTEVGRSILDKLKKLVIEAGMDEMDFKNKF